MRPHTFFQPLFCLLLCAFMLLPTGCTNDDYDHITDNGNDDYIPVDITFGGIETLFGPYGKEARNVQYNKIHESQDFDKKHMLETLVMAEPDTLRPPLTRSTSAVTNTTLRIVAYDQNNATYKGTGVYNISSTGAVTPKSGEELILKSGKYYFHCFTPAQAVSVSGNNVTVNLPTAGGSTDPAFYYARTASAVQLAMDANGKGNITIPTLQPKYCKLTLDVSHKGGTTTTYTDAVLAATLYKGASLALPAGTVTSNTPVTSTTIASTAVTIYTYPGATGSFKLTVNSVKVGSASKGNITTEANTAGMILSAGNAYKVGVVVTTKNYIKIIDLPFKVAKGNLLYNSGTGKWYMAPDQGYYCAADGGVETLSNNTSGYGSSGDKVFSYSNWGVQAKSPNFAITSSGPYADVYGGSTSGTHYGTKFGYNSTSATSASTAVSNYSNNNDPCYAALGGGWHLPTGGSTGSDIGKFAPASHTTAYKTYSTKSNLSSTSTRTVYGHYWGTTGQPSVADQDKYVFLPAVGCRDYGSTGRIDYEGSSGDGNYWSSTPYASNASNAYVLYFSSSNVSVGTYGYLRFSGHGVRCISYN